MGDNPSIEGQSPDWGQKIVLRQVFIVAPQSGDCLLFAGQITFSLCPSIEGLIKLRNATHVNTKPAVDSETPFEK